LLFLLKILRELNISKEHIRFERSNSEENFKKDLGIGRIYQIEKWFSDLGYSSDKYIIDKDFNIKVKRHLDLRGTNITSLPDNLSVKGGLYLSRTNITSLPDNLSVGGWLDLNGTKITLLSDNLIVKWSLDLSGTNITLLPDNLYVKYIIILDKNQKGKVYVPEHLKKKVRYYV